MEKPMISQKHFQQTEYLNGLTLGCSYKMTDFFKQKIIEQVVTLVSHQNL